MTKSIVKTDRTHAPTLLTQVPWPKLIKLKKA